MESDNLRTASLYINNQLLSRGLLRNGQTIEFSRPAQGEGGVEGTMGRVMSVINDLILRRDACLSKILLFLLLPFQFLRIYANLRINLARRNTTRNPLPNPVYPTCRCITANNRHGTLTSQIH